MYKVGDLVEMDCFLHPWDNMICRVIRVMDYGMIRVEAEHRITVSNYMNVPDSYAKPYNREICKGAVWMNIQRMDKK